MDRPRGVTNWLARADGLFPMNWLTMEAAYLMSKAWSSRSIDGCVSLPRSEPWPYYHAFPERFRHYHDGA
jgi:hypothetical protein